MLLSNKIAKLSGRQGDMLCLTQFSEIDMCCFNILNEIEQYSIFALKSARRTKEKGHRQLAT